MKEDLKRLMNEFLEETKSSRIVKKDLQLTNKMSVKFKYELREPTFTEFIDWLNSVNED